MEARDDARELAGLLRQSVRDILPEDGNAALMFSGGLDSAIIAAIARKMTDLRAYVLGLEGSHDILWARECASIIDLPLTELTVTGEEVVRSLEDVILNHRMTEPRWMSTFVAHNLAFSRIPEPAVMSGQGADELFGGYAKYLRDADPAAGMDRDIRNLVGEELPVYRSMARNHGKTLLAPFLEPSVLEFGRGVPVGRKICGSGNKVILREAAGFLGVPGMMADRRKKAMQYGTGVSGIIKKHLKDKGIDLRGLIDSIEI